MYIGEEVTGSFHDQFEVLCGLDQMIEDDVMTKFEVKCGYELMINDADMTKFKVLFGLERM
jgi:hypothetical protein